MSAGRTVRIEETTVATIDGWKVTVANIMRDKYTDASGASREGTTAVVGLYDEAKADKGEATVGEGSTLHIAGKSWRVGKVEAGKGAGNGHVELQAAQ